MGDASDYADVQRFMRSPEGQASLQKFRNSLLDKRIRDVEFTNNTCGVGIVLHLDYGKKLDLQDALNFYELYHLQKRYGQVLERENAKDSRNRKPTQ